MIDQLRLYGGVALRHALTYGSGILVYRGYVSAAEGEQMVSALMLLSGIGLSIAHKIKTQRQADAKTANSWPL